MIGRVVARFALLACFLFVARDALADGPPLPFIDRGACPFECCTYREWTVEADTPIRARRDPKAPLAFTAGRGETVHGLTGVVVTLEAGRVLATRDTQIGDEGYRTRVPKGTILYSLHDLGENSWLLWHQGRTFTDIVLSVEHLRVVPSGEPFEGSYLRAQTDPKTLWWVVIENATGDVGWSEHPENFGNKDACGG